MYIADLVRRINHKLSGMLLSQTDIINYMDEVIDDINSKMNSKFPTYTEAIKEAISVDDGLGIEPSMHGHHTALFNIDYKAIPDKYQRSVVVIGAASKFYETDEEGNPSAVMFRQDYEQALFYMVRDYSFSVPPCYQEDDQGFIGLSDAELEVPGMRVTNDPFGTIIGFK